VPHLRDGFIVDKVGYRAKRDNIVDRNLFVNGQKAQQIHMSSPKLLKTDIAKPTTNLK